MFCHKRPNKVKVLLSLTVQTLIKNEGDKQCSTDVVEVSSATGNVSFRRPSSTKSRLVKKNLKEKLFTSLGFSVGQT